MDEPRARAALDALLEQIFDLDLHILDSLDARDPTYTPFSYFDASRCVANVAVFAMPMMVRGERIDAFGVQSVAVRPEFRGRGLCRDLMERALAWCDARAGLMLLRTSIPELYLRFGFHAVREFEFVGQAPGPAPLGLEPVRPVRLPADASLLKRLLRTRAPVSDLAAVLGHGTMFLLNVSDAHSPRLDYVPGLDAVVATETTDAAWRLVDIVAPRIPSLATLLGALGGHPDRVRVCFPPDKLAFAAEPRPAATETVLMVRGRALDGLEPFMLPPTAAF
jgi:predicted N-acetyltransferase YhbS